MNRSRLIFEASFATYLVKEGVFAKQHLALVVRVQHLTRTYLLQQIGVIVDHVRLVSQTISIAKTIMITALAPNFNTDARSWYLSSSRKCFMWFFEQLENSKRLR